ncbi:MAG: site-specific DNA-methyltransferase [Nitrobacter sp. 62-13]|uniref:site-specific DNA-methyltransferase n=1 Tax=Nitrobacter sp. 62-13 TaxID=1895797 RepID=UPI00095EECE4|nr:site-specific DNA-methyltransferase [Nitrobacter sp. 62-13]OJU24201.1 MAG: site-specific DNA-methyltransferase [Nitrobacter sp. 62-13]
MAQDNGTNASIYKHNQETVQRPDAGVEAQFSNKKGPKTYRYDSSLAPELSWDESADRAFAEWLLVLVADAAEKGETTVFSAPQVWAGNGESFSSLSQCVARLRSLTKPFLNWTGKAERQQVTVPTLPLFVHERHSTQAILETLKSHKALGTNLDLFGDTGLDVADKLDAYEHNGPWTNRLILGDSLQVMNSLLEYEGMGGQVQMIYFDPPYGVKFGSNFQPFVRKNKVSDGSDDDMIREPEMVKAFRDTWELGLHSYLTYLRDRLLLARELLTPSGSVFIQISDENLSLVRDVVSEVFGLENYVVTIPVKKKGSQKGGLIDPVNDYLVWATKDKEQLRRKYNQLFEKAPLDSDLIETFRYVELPDGTELTIVELEKRESKPDRYYRDNPDLLFVDFPGARVFTSENYTGGKPGKSQAVTYTFKGRKFDPGISNGLGWKTDAVSEDGGPSGMDKLAKANRLFIGKNQLRYKRYHDDFGYRAISNWWDGFGGASDPIYVVQTNERVIERCVLMTSDPGDLIVDITCGSGSTAIVAEQWGRRWITCDTSRVPIALARQRLLTATFPWYRLRDPAQGPSGGFVYERKRNNKGQETGGMIPHIVASTIANDEAPLMETLVHRPERNNKITRVTGAFTVEATIQAAIILEEESGSASPRGIAGNPRAYLDRMIELLRQSKTLHLPGNVTLQLEAISPLADREYLHAEGLAKNGSEKRIAFVFGPEDGAIGSEYVFNAHTEALQQGFQQLFLFGFAIQAKAREMLDKLKVPTTYVAVTPDVVMSDLLKTSKTSEIFSITGLPDVTVEHAGKERDGTPLHRVVIKGLDIFRPDTMETDEVKAENLPCWMLDGNYNGMVFMATQVFFPKTGAWENLQKSLKGQFSDSVWEHLAGTVSEPFVLGDKKRIAVKAIDERGNELMVVKSAEGGH